MNWWLFKNKIKELLNIKDRLYKCECCGVYSYRNVTLTCLPPFENIEHHFCCNGCRDIYIDKLIPPIARKYGITK
jgi:hypothetical protein